MSIPYRTQQSLKRLAGTLLILLVVAVIAWFLWFLWLQRYVVYTRDDGAKLNFDISPTLPGGQLAQPPSEEESEIEIFYNEGEDQVNLSTDLSLMKGYYVTGETLRDDPDEVWEQIQALPENVPVMLELKSIRGTFYYSTSTGRPLYEEGNIPGVDVLLTRLRATNRYTIARVPALRDREYGLENTRDGLPTSGGYLWMDGQGCYWLNPSQSGVIEYMKNIASELRALGFDEVVFDEYYFPRTEEIVYKGDKEEALAATAQLLVNECATDTFAVSFVMEGSWNYPTGRTRIYRTDVNDAISLIEAAKNMKLENPAAQLVFITSNRDTRFEEYSVLRPIEMAEDIQ